MYAIIAPNEKVFAYKKLSCLTWSGLDI